MLAPLSFRIAAGLAISLLAADAHAITIALETPAPAPLGSIVAVDLEISGPGIGDFTAPSVRSFDFDVSFDNSSLSFLDVIFDGFLGAPGSEALTASAESPSGTVDLAAVSLLASATLDALQPDSFRLATLRFVAIAPGSGALAFTQTLVGDTAGAALAVGAATGTSVTVLPEPSPLVLLLAGLLPLGRRAGCGLASRDARHDARTRARRRRGHRAPP